MFPDKKDERPSWVIKASVEHPKVLDHATGALYAALRQPALGIPFALMDGGQKKQMVLDGVRQIYTQMLEAGEK